MKFFENSEHYEPLAILEYMPVNYLVKERVLLLAKSKKYKEAFSLCIETLQDVDYAMSVAHRAFKWHKDKAVYFHVFVRLLQSGQKEQATEVLKKNFHFI